MKKHILLIEKEENERRFFADALEESKLDFFCSNATSKEDAKRILKNIVPDIIFIDLNTTGNDVSEVLGNFNCSHLAPVILYSRERDKIITEATHNGVAGYFQLPRNLCAMAFILQGLINKDTVSSLLPNYSASF